MRGSRSLLEGDARVQRSRRAARQLEALDLELELAALALELELEALELEALEL